MKKTLSLILALIMVTAVLPLNAFASEEKKPVGKIEITLDSRIAGKSTEDYKDFLTVSGEGIEFEEDSFETKHIIMMNDVEKTEDCKHFAEGESYISTFRVHAQENYYLPNIFYADNETIVCHVIHQDDITTGFYDFKCVTTTEENADYYEIAIRYRVYAQEPTGFEKEVRQFFRSLESFFGSIIDFLLMLIYSPSDLIKKFL